MHDPHRRAGAWQALGRAMEREQAAWDQVQAAAAEHGPSSPEWAAAALAWQEVACEGLLDLTAWLRRATAPVPDR